MITGMFLLAVAVMATCQAEWTPPSFCRGKTCPPYTVMSSSDGYEIRKYKAAVWVEVLRSGQSRRDMFYKLFEYVKGKNAEGQRFDMTLPVVGHVNMASGHTESMRFYLGECVESFQPPKPTDPDVHVHHDPEMTYYVMGFRTDDWRNMNVWTDKANSLKSKIPAISSVTEYCAASYGPRGNDDKYNEVWIHTSSDHADHHHHHHDHDSGMDHHSGHDHK